MENKKRTLQKMPPLKIGNVEMPNPLVLAPMAGVTDLPFRVLCKEQGAGLICMEMGETRRTILYKNKNTEDLMTIDPGEHPVSLQLFGSDPEILGRLPLRSKKGRLIFWILTWAVRCQRLSITAKARPYEGSASGEGNRDKHGKGSEKACNRKDPKGL